MSVMKMALINIVGKREHLNDIASVCEKCGCFQPEDPLSFYTDTSHFTLLNEECPYTAPMSALKAAIGRLGGSLPAAAPLNLKKAGLLQYVADFTAEEARLSESVTALQTALETCRKDAEQFEHFKGLGIGLDEIQHCETIKVRFGRLPKESYDKLDIYSDNPYVLFFPGSSEGDYYWGVYFAPQDFSDEVDRIFTSLYFERMRIPDAVGTPETVLAQLREQQSRTEAALNEAKAAAAAYLQSESEKAAGVYARLEELDRLYQIRRFAVRYSDGSVMMTGWIPAENEAAFSRELKAVPGTECICEPPESVAHHTPPVKLKNARLFRPFEYFVTMYGMPSYGEIDPTAFLAITYTVLFGIMFGDLGQGLIVSLVGWFMWHKKQMSIGRILIPCGLSAAVCGTVFGSVFGFEHALDWLYRLMGFSEKPIEIMQSAISIILFAVGLGLALIFVSMVLNIVSGLRRHDYENALFGPNGIAGFVFFGSLIVGFGGQLALGWSLISTPYVLGLIVLPLLLIFLREPLGKLVAGDKDWAPEKWGEFAVQNFFEVFEILLTYLSNTMSFMRVGAFVLIHAGMMLAVFTLAGLFGPVGYTVTVVLGNLLVMVMEALLVAIQVMRLEFYELFSRYYTGEGRPFTPLTFRTENN